MRNGGAPQERADNPSQGAGRITIGLVCLIVGPLDGPPTIQLLEIPNQPNRVLESMWGHASLSGRLDGPPTIELLETCQRRAPTENPAKTDQVLVVCGV